MRHPESRGNHIEEMSADFPVKGQMVVFQRVESLPQLLHAAAVTGKQRGPYLQGAMCVCSTKT